MALWISPLGGARPEEIITVLGLAAWLEAGTVMERTDLEIIDELPAGMPSPPALETAFEEIGTNDGDLRAEVIAPSRPTAIIEDPMSFDS